MNDDWWWLMIDCDRWWLMIINDDWETQNWENPTRKQAKNEGVACQPKASTSAGFVRRSDSQGSWKTIRMVIVSAQAYWNTYNILVKIFWGGLSREPCASHTRKPYTEVIRGGHTRIRIPMGNVVHWEVIRDSLTRRIPKNYLDKLVYASLTQSHTRRSYSAAIHGLGYHWGM